MTFPKATIDLAALRHNLGVARRFAPDSKVMAIVKANGYGHGAVNAARALSNADALGVARYDEAMALRAASVTQPIVLLEGVFSPRQLESAADESLQIVVHSPEQIEMLERCSRARQFEIWCKVDTGMNRLGFRLEELPEVWQRLRSLTPTRLRLMTHLSAAEVRDSAMTDEQAARLGSVAVEEGVERSLANSAGLILSETARADWVRPGLMLYGVSPVLGTSASELGLKPAMTLTTQLIAVRQVRAGETVGYNGIWTAGRDSAVGIAAIGYGDGYPRNTRSGTPVLVRGRQAQVVGRISMDMTAIDVTGMDARVGDQITLWGEGLPVEHIAPYAGTIAYELLCGITQRVAMESRGID